MRKILTYNYWLMIVAWCMFLNNLTLLAILFGLAACAVLTSISRKINHWRLCTTGLITFIAISFFLSNCNVTYFFPKLSFFLAVICLNCSFTNEYLYLFKPKYIVPYFIVMSIAVSIFSIITVLLPDSSYSMFTKNSLFTMESIIFLPYLIPVTYCLIYKKVRDMHRRNHFPKKELTIM